MEVPAEPKELFFPDDGSADELEVLRRLRDAGRLRPPNKRDDPTGSDPDEIARPGNGRA